MNRKSTLFLLIFSTSILFNCEKKVWENPFDTKAPKEVFTPSKFSAAQAGNKINLTWAQTNTKISNFILERNVENSGFIKVANITVGTLSYTDAVQANGKIHQYRITAVAGGNSSNTVTTSVTPTAAPNINSAIVVNKTFATITIAATVSDEGAPISSKGICWSTSPNPTISNSKTTDGSGATNFNSIITNLNSNVKYYFRPYAINAVGTSYGPEQSITLVLNTPGPTATDGSGNYYNSVQIGDQTWLSKNLITTKYQNGQSIPLVADNSIWSSQITGAYCDFFNRDDIGKIYGHLYNHFAALDSRNICPAGWHIPNKTEADDLISYLGGQTSAAIKLKEAGNTYWITANGDNASGFSARAGSWRSQEGIFYYSIQTGGANFWTSSKKDNQYPWFFTINSETTAKTTTDWYFQSAAGGSVRCLKN